MTEIYCVISLSFVRKTRSKKKDGGSEIFLHPPLLQASVCCLIWSLSAMIGQNYCDVIAMTIVFCCY